MSLTEFGDVVMFASVGIPLGVCCMPWLWNLAAVFDNAMREALGNEG